MTSYFDKFYSAASTAVRSMPRLKTLSIVFGHEEHELDLLFIEGKEHLGLYLNNCQPSAEILEDRQ